VLARTCTPASQVGATVESDRIVALSSHRPALVAAVALIALALGGVALFLRAQQALTGNLWGVPLDDAYIHFRFTQNLAAGHGFAFNPDQPVPGSTSPLWVLLLAVPTLCGMPVWIAAKLYGALFLAASAVLAWRLARRYIAGPVAAWSVGALTALDGRLLWAAPSGMEVTLFTALSLAAFLARPAPCTPLPALRRRLLLVAALCGLATLARPEGYLLTAVLCVDLAPRLRPPLAAMAPPLALYLLLVAPYNLFALLMTGRPLPTTFYAKSVPLGAATLPHAAGYLVVLLYLLIAGNVVTILAPLGALVLWRRAGRPRSQGAGDARPSAGALLSEDGAVRAVVAWPVLLLAEQAVLSPVLYHFGRYVMPLQPFLLLWTVAAVARLTRVSGGRGRGAWREALPPLALALLTALGLPAWAQRYALSVDNIDRMQVALGYWVRAHVPPGAPVATHDIGAIGYISGHRVVDIEGLVTPRFLVLKREQPEGRRAADILAEVRRRHARYLIVFPRAYRSLTTQPDLRSVYSVTVAHPTIVQEPTMVVYEVESRKSKVIVVGMPVSDSLIGSRGCFRRSTFHFPLRAGRARPAAHRPGC